MSKIVDLEVPSNFTVEWYDRETEAPRQFNLAFYPRDSEVELCDLKTKRLFLKKTPMDIRESDLFVGACLTIFARQYRVMDFGDSTTRKKLSTESNRVLALLKPSAFPLLGSILDTIYKTGVTVVRLKSMVLNFQQAMYVCANDEAMARDISNGHSVSMELRGPMAQSIVCDVAMSEGEPLLPSVDNTDEEAMFYFENNTIQTPARQNNCTVCIVKPHCVAGKVAGEILQTMQETFDVSAVQIFNLDVRTATEFLDVYYGVLPHFNGMLDELTKGPCLVMELYGEDVLNKNRRVCGPPIPAIARHIAPDCLRALYGVDKVRNGVHCTDLPEDGSLESSYFFNTINKLESVKNSFW